MKSLFRIHVAGAVLSFVATGCLDMGSSYYYIPSNSEMTSIVGAAVNRYTANPYGMTSVADRVKDPAARAGWFVTMFTYWDGYRNSYVYTALNTDQWAREASSRGLSVNQFVTDYFSGYITIPDWKREQFYTTVYPAGYNMYQDQFGNLYDAAGAAEKDLETLQTVNEDIALQTSGRTLSAEFGLSEEQGFRVARLAKEWQTISKSRQMTSSDLEAFSEDLSGMKLSELRNAAKLAAQGDKSSAEDLINRAASNLDTTPENMKVILEKLMGQ